MALSPLRSALKKLQPTLVIFSEYLLNSDTVIQGTGLLLSVQTPIRVFIPTEHVNRATNLLESSR